MERRRESYWLFVLLMGPVGGAVAGAFWTVFMALTMQDSIWRVFFPFGLFFTACMMVLLTLFCAWSFRTVRHELKADKATESQTALMPSTSKLKYRVLEQADGYY